MTWLQVADREGYDDDFPPSHPPPALSLPPISLSPLTPSATHLLRLRRLKLSEVSAFRSLTCTLRRIVVPVTVTGRRHRSPSPVDVTGRRHQLPSPVDVTCRRHWLPSPVAVTGRCHQLASPVAVTGRRHQQAAGNQLSLSFSTSTLYQSPERSERTCTPAPDTRARQHRSATHLPALHAAQRARTWLANAAERRMRIRRCVKQSEVRRRDIIDNRQNLTSLRWRRWHSVVHTPTTTRQCDEGLWPRDRWKLTKWRRFDRMHSRPSSCSARRIFDEYIAFFKPIYICVMIDFWIDLLKAPIRVLLSSWLCKLPGLIYMMHVIIC